MRRASAVCALAALVSATSAQTPLLTLDQALQLAQQRSHALAAQASAAAGARQMAVAAGQLPDPVVKVGVNNLPLNGADRFSLTSDFMTMRSIGVMQEFTRGDKRQARAARYDSEAQVAEAGRLLALAELRRDTAMAWLERYNQERLRELLGSQRAEATLQIDAADAAYRGGRGSPADVVAARSALAQIDDRIRQADLQVAVSRAALARWVGGDGAQALGAPPALAAVRLDGAQLETQLERHPQIVLLARQEETARAEAEIARSNRSADWSVELMYSQRGPAYSNMVSVNAAVPLQWDRKNRQDRELAARLAGAEQLRAQRDETLRALVAQTRIGLLGWHATQDRLAHYDRTLIPLAADATRAAVAAYRGGTQPLAAVLAARRSEIDTRIERLRLEMEAAGLWARLEYLIPVEDAAPTLPRAATLSMEAPR